MRKKGCRKPWSLKQPGLWTATVRGLNSWTIRSLFAGALVIMSALSLPAQGPTPGPLGLPGEKDEEEIDRIRVQALVQVGLSPGRNMVRANTWSPLTVTLTNEGLGFEGDVEIDFIHASGEQYDPRRYRRTYRMPVAMPEKIKGQDPPVKRYSMPLYIEETDYELRAWLHVRTGSWLGGSETLELGRVPLNFLRREDRFIVVASDTPGEHTHFSELSTTPAVPLRRVVDTPPDLLPEAWNEYLGANVVVLDTRRLAEIPGASIRALGTWVEAGGRLIVCGGDTHSLLRRPPWTEILPVRVTGYEMLEGSQTLSARFGDPESPLTGSLLVSRGVAGGTGEVLVNEGDIPLVARKRLGLGSIYYVAFNLRDTALRRWSGKGDLSRFLFDLDQVPGLAEQLEAGEEQPVEEALLTEQLMDIPDPKLIGGIFLLYILVAVPLNYLFLRWIRKMELVWISLPFLAGAFSIGIYAYNQLTRVQRMNYSALTVLETELGCRTGRGRNYWSIYSPSRVNLSLRVEGENVLPAEPLSGNRNPEMSAEVMEFTWENGMRISRLPVRHQSNRLFTSTGFFDLGGAIEGDLVYDGDSISGTIENRSEHDLRLLHFMAQGRGVRLGRLKPGESRSIRIRPTAGPEGDLVQVYPDSLQVTEPGQTAGGPSGDLWVADLAWKTGFSYFRDRPGYYLVGVSTDGPSDLVGGNEMVALSKATLVGVRLPVRIAPGRRVTVGGRAFRRIPEDFTTVVQEGGIPVTLGFGDWTSIIYEPVFFRLEDARLVNVSVSVQAEQHLYRREYDRYGQQVQSDATAITDGSLVVQVFNRRKGDWESIPVLSRRLSLSPAEDYVDLRFPRVRLRIMVSEKADRNIQCTVKDAEVLFTFEGGESARAGGSS